jgi:hypothetical protein
MAARLLGVTPIETSTAGLQVHMVCAVPMIMTLCTGLQLHGHDVHRAMAHACLSNHAVRKLPYLRCGTF